MKWFLSLLFMAGCCTGQCLADRPIFLVTPAGVFRSDIGPDGRPKPWEIITAYAIVDGFTPTEPQPPMPDPPTIPVPPVSDPIVEQIAAISKATIRDKNEATAVAAIIDTIVKMNLPASDFKEVFEIAISMADESLGLDRRMIEWTTQVFAVTEDPVKMKAGLVSAFGVDPETLHSIETGKSLDFAKLIMVLQKIVELIELFRNFGKFGGT